MAHDPQPLDVALELLLVGLIAEHERLLDAVERHRAAISRADASLIQAAVNEQAEILGRIADLERRRAAVARTPAGHPITISDLARTLPEPPRTRLLQMTERLRSLIHALRDRQAVVRAATQALLAHTHGLMAQVGAALSHAGTYGRAGRVQPANVPASAVLDLSS